MGKRVCGWARGSVPEWKGEIVWVERENEWETVSGRKRVCVGGECVWGECVGERECVFVRRREREFV